MHNIKVTDEEQKMLLLGVKRYHRELMRNSNDQCFKDHPDMQAEMLRQLTMAKDLMKRLENN